MLPLVGERIAHQKENHRQYRSTCIQASGCRRETYIFSTLIATGRGPIKELFLVSLSEILTGFHSVICFGLVEVMAGLLGMKGRDVSATNFDRNTAIA